MIYRIRQKSTGRFFRGVLKASQYAAGAKSWVEGGGNYRLSSWRCLEMAKGALHNIIGMQSFEPIDLGDIEVVEFEERETGKESG